MTNDDEVYGEVVKNRWYAEMDYGFTCYIRLYQVKDADYVLYFAKDDLTIYSAKYCLELKMTLPFSSSMTSLSLLDGRKGLEWKHRVEFEINDLVAVFENFKKN